jgi:uncharacterized membrane protein (UPF0127 family)
MKSVAALLLALCSVLAPACAQSPARGEYAPAQLRSFARDTLIVQRSGGRDQFHIWLAESPEQHQQGLMWIQQLPPDYGMLFLLEGRRPMSMWMKNTFVRLDMLFFDPSGRITHIHELAVPQSEDIIDSGGEVAGVLEILGGEARRRGIRIGDRLLHRRLGQ